MTSTWIGQEILGYTLTREIGSGSYGVVYLGEKKNRFGTSCRAIKRISVGEDEMSALTDVMRELETVSHLTGVTNVVTYYDNHVIEAEENGQKRIHVFILMDYMTPLASHIKSADMTVGDAVQMAVDILAALRSCHGRQIIHRDIKEDNIFIDRNGRYCLGDFGVAKYLAGCGSTSTMRGTELYMAPEVCLHREYTTSVDLYSLGIVLYRMTNHGRAPFLPPFPNPLGAADHEAALKCRMERDPDILPAQAQNPFGAVILQALRSQSARYQTADEFLSAVMAAQAQITGEFGTRLQIGKNLPVIQTQPKAPPELGSIPIPGTGRPTPSAPPTFRPAVTPGDSHGPIPTSKPEQETDVGSLAVKEALADLISAMSIAFRENKALTYLAEFSGEYFRSLDYFRKMYDALPDTNVPASLGKAFWNDKYKCIRELTEILDESDKLTENSVEGNRQRGRVNIGFSKIRAKITQKPGRFRRFNWWEN